MIGCIQMCHQKLQQWEPDHRAANGGPDGELDLFGAPPSMNLADERSPEAGRGAAKDEDN